MQVEPLIKKIFHEFGTRSDCKLNSIKSLLLELIEMISKINPSSIRPRPVNYDRLLAKFSFC